MRPLSTLTQGEQVALMLSALFLLVLVVVWPLGNYLCARMERAEKRATEVRLTDPTPESIYNSGVEIAALVCESVARAKENDCDVGGAAAAKECATLVRRQRRWSPEESLAGLERRQAAETN